MKALGIGILLFVFCIIFTQAQQLTGNLRISPYTYIYKLSNKEASRYQNLEKTSFINFSQEDFHTLIDSFPTFEDYKSTLAPGQYLKVFVKETDLVIEPYTVNNCIINLKNNSTDLCIEVVDMQGNIVPDAKVKINSQTIRFDKKTQLYRIHKSNKKGMLAVTWLGNTQFLDLGKELNNSGFKRGSRKLVYGTPLKYVVFPLYNLIRLPFDAVYHLIVPYGYNRSFQYFRQGFNRIIYYDNSRNYKNRNERDGFVVFNKPVYKPGDTVRCKAYIVNNAKRPINKPLDLYFGNWRDKKSKHLGTVNPYRPGGYSYDFVLDKSLNLKIDKDYDLYFMDGEYSVVYGKIRLEDYELIKSNLKVRQPSNNHIAGTPFRFYAKGIDDNALNLPDASLRVVITPGNISEIKENIVFIADTLLDQKLLLSASGETEITIPDSIFKAESMNYSVRMIMTTSEYDKKEQTFSIPFMHHFTDIEYSFTSDSITISYSIDGKITPINARLEGTDAFANNIYTENRLLPVTLAIDPLINSIEVDAGTTSKIIDMKDQVQQIFCTSGRENGHIYIQVFNPRNLPFTYYLYKNNKQIMRGYGREFLYNQGKKNKNNYYLSIQYVWAGEVQKAEFSIPYRQNHLQVKVEQPRMVIPGQKAQIDISVEDADGKPVPDADVTALAFTAKFDKPLPEIGNFISEKQHSRRLINTFELNNYKIKGIYTDHNDLYTNWIKPKQLDTMSFFRLAYPIDSIFSYTVSTIDGITQFSPFVTHNGNFEPIQAIYVDQRPVYIASRSTGFMPYSFAVSPGTHTIMLRTSEKQIMIRNVSLKWGHKTIFSISDEAQLTNVSIKYTEKNKYSENEEQYLRSYIMPFRSTFLYNIAYIKQRGEVMLLNYDLLGNASKPAFAGPLRAEEFELKQTESWGCKTDFEPGFEYEFNPGLVKMRMQNDKAQPNLYFDYTARLNLSDTVLTEKAILEMWETLKLKKLTEYFSSQYVSSSGWWNSGKLIMLQSNSLSGFIPNPLFHIIFKRGEPGFAAIRKPSAIINLGAGFYDIITILPGYRYLKSDSVEIRSRQTTVINAFRAEDIHPSDSISLKLCELLYLEYIENKVVKWDTKRDFNTVQRSYADFMQFSGEGRYITGKVFSEYDKDPVPGVTVLLKGTSNGTLTDLDGNFRIKIPNGNPVLQFSFIGMNTKEIETEGIENLQVFLSSTAVNIEGVVVTALGISREKNSIVSGATVTSEEISDIQVRGVSSLSGRVAGVQLTNYSLDNKDVSSSNTQKLIVVDGVLFYGNWSDFDKTSIHHTEELSSEQAIAQYGEKASNGVLLVTTNTGFARSAKGAGFDDVFAEAAKNSTSLRSNFSDYAFWQPQLRTDKEGKASFNVKFPDDVTNWQTTVMAVTDSRKTGQSKGSVKAFKPLSAQIAMPRFLVAGDSVNAIGKVINYDAGSVPGNSELKVDGTTVFNHAIQCTNVVIDTLPFVATANDSVNITYSFRADNGYFDGESRNLEIIPQGAELNVGQFFVLHSDTMVVAPVFESGTDSITITIDISELAILLDETEKVYHYIHNCNEQMASKLKALLSRKMIQEFKGESYNEDHEINKIIGLLEKNQNDEGMWGWWGKSSTSLWMSKHIIEALASAEKAGYKVAFNKERTSQYLIWHSTDNQQQDSYMIAQMLSAMPDYVGLPEVVQNLERKKNPTLSESMFILELRQKLGLPFNIDSLVSSFDTTIYGNMYIPNDINYYYTYNNTTSANLSAYRIIRGSGKYSDLLPLIRNYFFETRRSGCWRNTYESTSIIETILPDITYGSFKKHAVIFEGDVNMVIDTFPFTFKVKPTAQFTIQKTGVSPIYISTFQPLKVTNPEAKTDYFNISTKFRNTGKNNTLIAGQKVTCTVFVDVKKEADYVMIQVPIPAGCSYDVKTKKSYEEAHREYYKNQVNIYFNRLHTGKHTFEFELMPKYTGSFTLNPAKAEPMYLPLMYGNSEVKKVKIISQPN